MRTGSRHPTYASGEEIHVGDRVLHAGETATVVFVTSRDEFATGYPPDEWNSHVDRFMIRTDSGEHFEYRESDEDLVLLNRIHGEADK